MDYTIDIRAHAQTGASAEENHAWSPLRPDGAPLHL